MSTEVVAPAAGESVTEIEVSNWKVKDGDLVKKDQIIVEVETEKASLEVRSPVAGRISIIEKSGAVVKPGAKIANIFEDAEGEVDVKGESPNVTPPNSSPANPPPTPDTTLNANLGSEVEISVPNFGESVKEGEITNWKVENGAIVIKDQVLLQIESDKASLDVVAPVAGKLTILVDSGKVNVGQKIGNISVSNEASDSPSPQITQPKQPSETETKSTTLTAPVASFSGNESDLNIYASPSVRKMLLENNVDINDFLLKSTTEESSKSISTEDVKKYLAERSAAKNVTTAAKDNSVDAVSKPAPIVAMGNRESVSKKMTRLRQTIAKRLVNAQQTSALLTTFNEIDMGEVMSIRSHYKELFKKKHEVGLGFMSFFVKAACQALQEFPVVNSMVDNDQIVENHFVDMGIAVATPKGLVVPVIRNAESLSFKKIEETILGFAKKGKEGTISMDDLMGGTFTITNGGTFGSMLSTPIINFPQSAILGMHNIVERAVVKNGEIVIRPVMYVALTYDHRIIDGADSVKFLYRIKEFIEDPHRLLVGV